MDAAPLLSWYAAVARPLPWRRTRDPYAILVSEVMCQQTQAGRVVGHFERFLTRFPDAEALAAAPPAEVLRLWSGLGYNRRALALQRAAQHVAAHGWPRAAEGLRALPGVGPYTAAAVASFAFGERVRAVDTNWRRVEARHGSAPADPAPDVNQAMMELGATVCTARAARCGDCPVAATCAAHAAGGPAIPARARPGTARAARFEDTDRFLRGRVVAALLAGEPLPSGAERVVGALRRDGLIDLGDRGEPVLPAGRMGRAEHDLVPEDSSGP